MGALVAAEDEKELSGNLERLGDEILVKLNQPEPLSVDDLLAVPAAEKSSAAAE
jgi:hypothetical protein